MLQISFEWFEFAFECFESLLNGSNLHSKASNPFRMVKISIQHFTFLSKGSNLHLNASNLVRMLRIPFE